MAETIITHIRSDQLKFKEKLFVCKVSFCYVAFALKNLFGGTHTMRTKQSLQLEREPFRFSLKLKKRINLNLKKKLLFFTGIPPVFLCKHCGSMYTLMFHV